MTERIAAREYHPRHGTHDPTASTPARRPGSIRRTSTIDMLRPEGLFQGELLLIGRARDLLTDRRGEAKVLDEATMELTVAFLKDRRVTRISAAPDDPEVQQLVGARASSGFRSALDRALPGDRDAQTLRYLMLDDVPVATLVSGHALMAGGYRPDASHFARNADLCAGWRTGGTILEGIEKDERPPVVTGPPAPSLLREDDPLAWHECRPLPPTGMRRHRRLDLLAGEVLEIDALFRDSYVLPDGVETVIHEYTVRGRLDPDSQQILALEATPQALPWLECPAAADSAGWLVGRSITDLRRYVRDELTGPLTCTHLNDTLRSLADISVLARRLEAAA